MRTDWDNKSFGDQATLRTKRGAEPENAGEETPTAEEEASFGDRDTLRDGWTGEEEASFGDRETLRDEEGWGILEEWGGKRWKPGEEILGRYEVLSELGQGGMGVVYSCLDKVGGVKVAVKALPPELSHNSVEMEEVRANFELVYGLSHPNIAGVRTLEKDSRGEYFLVMEVAGGEPLRRWMRRKSGGGGQKGENGGTGAGGKGIPTGGKGIPLAEALPVLRQVAAALDYAHWKKVVHRDVKPGNVMIDESGNVKVLDFGLAAQIRTSLSRASQAYRGTSGTGPYMAPEQWRGQPQDGTADQYALGVVAYEMLAGRLPFENSELAVLREVVLRENIPDIPGLPSGAMRALRRAMAKREEERWPSCEAFVEALGGGRPKGRGRQRSGWSALLAALLAAGAGIGTWALLDHVTKGKRGPDRIAPGVGSERAKQFADDARADAENAKKAVEAIVGGMYQSRYKAAEASWAEAERAYEEENYNDAAKQWFEATRLYTSAKDSADRDLRENADGARRQAVAAQGSAAVVTGGREQASYGEAEAQLATGDAAYGQGDYAKAQEAWNLATEKFGMAEKEAKQSLQAAAKKSAEAALEEARKTKAEAEKVAGIATQAEYGEAQGALAEGDTMFQKGYFDEAKMHGERATGKYKAAMAVAIAKKQQTEKLDALLAAAQEAEETEWWEEVKRKAEEALRMDRDHPEANRLWETAEKQLRAFVEPAKAKSEREPGTLRWVKLPNGDEMGMVWCPPGATGPHGESLPGFWLGQTEVTQGQWESLMGSGVRRDKRRGVTFPDEANWPMRAVSWAECVEFCEELNAKLKLKRGVWRLPREAEWTWANQEQGKETGFAWFRENSGGQPHRVKEGIANAWGLYDMRGNVEEWCEERWDEKDEVSREFRVIRGGAYNSAGERRRPGKEGTPEPTVGFRVCLEE